jgi:hypothetical protein
VDDVAEFVLIDAPFGVVRNDVGDKNAVMVDWVVDIGRKFDDWEKSSKPLED